MIAVWWLLGCVGYLTLGVVVSMVAYRIVRSDHGDSRLYDREEDALMCMGIGIFWALAAAVVLVVAPFVGWHHMLQRPDIRRERAAQAKLKLDSRTAYLEGEIYGDGR